MTEETKMGLTRLRSSRQKPRSRNRCSTPILCLTCAKGSLSTTSEWTWRRPWRFVRKWCSFDWLAVFRHGPWTTVPNSLFHLPGSRTDLHKTSTSNLSLMQTLCAEIPLSCCPISDCPGLKFPQRSAPRLVRDCKQWNLRMTSWAAESLHFADVALETSNEQKMSSAERNNDEGRFWWPADGWWPFKGFLFYVAQSRHFVPLN
jgi:hypothetical protein